MGRTNGLRLRLAADRLHAALYAAHRRNAYALDSGDAARSRVSGQQPAALVRSHGPVVDRTLGRGGRIAEPDESDASEKFLATEDADRPTVYAFMARGRLARDGIGTIRLARAR